MLFVCLLVVQHFGDGIVVSWWVVVGRDWSVNPLNYPRVDGSSMRLEMEEISHWLDWQEKGVGHPREMDCTLKGWTTAM